jgi:hypothetical protein
MKYRKTILLLLLVLAAALTASAQKGKNRNYVILHDTITGKDTALHGGTFLQSAAVQRQYAIQWIKGDTVRLFTPQEIVGYREGNVTYETKLIPVGGEVRQAMVPRRYQTDLFVLYLFVNDEGEKEYYFQEVGDNNRLLTAMQGDGIHTLIAFLEKFPAAAKHEEVRNYIRSMKPTPSDFRNRYRVASTGNLNYILRPRWGVMAGIGTFKPEDIFFKAFSAQIQPHVGAFVNLPLIADFSLQLELSYRRPVFSKSSVARDRKFDAVYNRHDLIPGLFARYSVNSLRGKWIPYLQAGFEPKIVLSGNAENQALYAQLADGRWFFGSWKKEERALKSYIPTFAGGAGVEYKLSFRHSLFFDIRYNYEFADERINGFSVSLSYNL